MTLQELVERYNFLTDTIKMIDDLDRRITTEIKKEAARESWDPLALGGRKAICMEFKYAMDIQGLLNMLKNYLEKELNSTVTAEGKVEE